VEDYYRRIGIAFETESMAELAADFFAGYAPRLAECSLHEGVLDALEQLEGAGIRQFVLSAMEEGMLHVSLRRLGIAEFFEGIYGLSHQEADSKLLRGRELLDGFNLDPSSTVLIGDTEHDAEVGVALGVRPILVATGHQAQDRLAATGSQTVRDIPELLPVLLGT
jgi:phosphoglycolate phosphatase